jgi:hypothetical protein
LLVTLPSPHPGAPTRPSTPKVLQARERAQLLVLLLFSPFGLIIESIKGVAGASRYSSPSHIFIIVMKSHTKTSFNSINLIKKCIVFNSTIFTFKPNNKVSTLINKDKLDLEEGIVGVSNAIFMKK